jgi:hypothetical protein
MKTVVSTFTSAADARRAVEELRRTGFPDDRINMLAPGAEDRAAATVPTAEGEAPGMGKAVGGVVGGAVGIATGVPLGAAASSVLLPGVGPVIAVGVLAGAVLGLGGAALGGAMENAMMTGLPKDELFFYEEALRRGRTVVIALAESDAEAERAREAFTRAGAESLDAARERWWLGLRSAEDAAYAARGGNFRGDESLYRRGFEAALAPESRTMSGDDLDTWLAARHGDLARTPAFRAGFERGRDYYRGLGEATRLSRSA